MIFVCFQKRQKHRTGLLLNSIMPAMLFHELIASAFYARSATLAFDICFGASNGFNTATDCSCWN